LRGKGEDGRGVEKRERIAGRGKGREEKGRRGGEGEGEEERGKGEVPR